MQIKEIAELIQIIEQSGIEEFELERSGVRIRVKKGKAHTTNQPVIETAGETPAAAIAAETPVAATQDESIAVFKAPIIGTFYIAPKPDAEPFVKVGETVSRGQVLCIIEAMKIFNQIESDLDGEVVRILAESGQPVEYGQPLFEIRQPL